MSDKIEEVLQRRGALTMLVSTPEQLRNCQARSDVPQMPTWSKNIYIAATN